MRTIIDFEIADLPAMTNAIGRKHWTVKHRERVKWQRLVRDKCHDASLNALQLDSATLTLERHSSKEPDFDGLVSGFKVVIDSLVKEGILLDDKPSIIGSPTFKWKYRPKKQGGLIKVKIEVEE